MRVLINPSSNSLPIIHSLDYTAFYGIMNGIGLFSDSIHSISSVFATLELFFFSHSSFSSFSLFILPLFSHLFIVILLLLGITRLFILFFQTSDE